MVIQAIVDQLSRAHKCLTMKPQRYCVHQETSSNFDCAAHLFRRVRRSRPPPAQLAHHYYQAGQHPSLVGYVRYRWSKARWSTAQVFRAGDSRQSLDSPDCLRSRGPAVGSALDVRLLCAAKATLSLHGWESWARIHCILSQVSPYWKMLREKEARCISVSVSVCLSVPLSLL